MQSQNRNSDLGACSQIAVFTYAVMWRTPRREIRLAAPFADNLMNSVAHCGGLPSAARGVLFVLKTPFFAKKIQKHEILPYKKLLFSLSVQNEEIPYKNS